MSKKVLFASSEVYPFAKTGGLADVAYALPRALQHDCAAEVIMPLYSSIDREKYAIKPSKEPFDIAMGEHYYSVEMFECVYDGVLYHFVYSSLLCDKEFLYGTPQGDYEDNAIRFGIFAYAVTEFLRRNTYDIVHLNDWQCALVALLVRGDPSLATKTLYTIHNLAYQGVFAFSAMENLGIDVGHFTMDGIEFYSKINLMKAGIAYSDAMSTVSPTYAKEILTPPFGCGLEGFLSVHKRKLHGIINGIDADLFSPATDSALTFVYNNAKEKKGSKKDLLKTLGLTGLDKPLFVFIGRFVQQKGVELLLEALPKIASMECNIVVLGEGEYHEELRALGAQYDNVHVTFGYDESFSHRMYAAGDFLLMPSLFEPCGLSQLIAFAYGALPIVHHVGGLADTVCKFENFTRESDDGYGVVFNTPTSRALLGAIRKAFEIFKDKKRFEAIVNHNMQCDVSWSKSAQAYNRLYEELS